MCVQDVRERTQWDVARTSYIAFEPGYAVKLWESGVGGVVSGMREKLTIPVDSPHRGGSYRTTYIYLSPLFTNI